MFQYDGNGAPDEYDVKPDVPVTNIPGVHLYPFVVGCIAAAAGLPHAGDARTDHVEVFDVFAVFRYFSLYDGAWPNEAHLPF